MTATSVRPPAAEVVGRQFVRDPDTYLAVVAVLVGVVSVAQMLLYPPGRSHAEYLTWGNEILSGRGPLSLWSYRAPGIALMYAFFAQGGVVGMLTMRLLEVVVLLGAFPLFSRLTKKLLDNERIGMLGAGLALFVHAQLEFEHTGQPEFFATACLAAALWVVLRCPGRTREWRSWILAGLLLGAAILFAPTLGLFCLPVLVVAAWHPGLTELRRAPLWAIVVGIGAGLLVVLGGFAAWLMGRGSLGAFGREWVSPMLALVTTTNLEQLAEWGYFCADRLLCRQSAIVPVGCLLAYAAPRLHARERKALGVFLGLVVAQLAAFTLMMESNPGRLSAALPWLSLIAGVGIYKVWRRALGIGRAGLVAFWGATGLLAVLCTAVGVPPGTYWSRSRARWGALVRAVPARAAAQVEAELYDSGSMSWPSSRRVAGELVARGHGCDFVVVGDEPQIDALLGCRPLGRLVRPLSVELALAAPALEQRLSSLWYGLRPRFVVLAPNMESSVQSLAVAHSLPPAVLETEYRPCAELDGWAILERVPSP